MLKLNWILINKINTSIKVNTVEDLNLLISEYELIHKCKLNSVQSMGVAQYNHIDLIKKNLCAQGSVELVANKFGFRETYDINYCFTPIDFCNIYSNVSDKIILVYQDHKDVILSQGGIKVKLKTGAILEYEGIVWKNENGNYETIDYVFSVYGGG